jgi:uncharacterized protein
MSTSEDAVSFAAWPATAAFAHQDARTGFEVVYFESCDDGCRIEGTTAAVEDGQTWVVEYSISLDPTGCTRNAHVVSRSHAGSRSEVLETDGAGRWTVNGQAASGLDGCLDVDLESSAVTNALPVRRMSLATGQRAEAPAAYVRAIDLSVERLDQTYERVTDDGPRSCYDYTAPAFEFSCRLVYDESGLVIEYPGIAVRVL